MEIKLIAYYIINNINSSEKEARINEYLGESEYHDCLVKWFCFFIHCVNKKFQCSRCGSAVVNLSSGHEDTGLILVLTQWAEDVALP